MGVLDDLLARLAPAPDDPIAQFLGVRNNRRRLATEAAGVPFGALGAGMEVPQSFAPPPAPPPIAQQPPVAFDAAGAGNMPQAPAPAPMAAAAPAIEPPAEVPAGPRPKEVDGTVVPPTDVSSASPPGAPMNIVPPPQAPAAAPEQPFSFGRLAGNVMDGLKNNSATLLALGAGFAGAPNIGQGISRASAAAIPASQADLKNRLLLQGQNQTYGALIKRGVPEDVAKAAMLNPEILKQVIPGAFGPKAYEYKIQPDGAIYQLDPSGKEPPKKVSQAEVKPEFQHVAIKGALGGETPAVFDKTKGVFLDMAVNPIKSDAIGGPGTPDAAVLAPGVKYDPAKTGQDYFDQFSPDVKAAAKSYINGDAMPVGNPRLKTIWDYAKTVAQRYSQEIGQPYTDNEYNAKRKMMTDLASSGPSSIGGILSNGKSAFGHLANLSDKFVDLGNFSGPSVIGGGHIGTAGNYIGNTLLPSPETKAKITAAEDNALKYGAEATKFYAGTGGGVQERMHALKETDAKTTTALQQAAFLETEKQLMLERIHQKEAQVRSVMGDDFLKRKPIMDADVQKTIAKIDENIAKLRGTAPAAAPVTVKTIDEAKALKPGTKFIDPNGIERTR